MTHRHMTHHQILFLSMLAVGCVATCAAAQHPETEYSSGQQIALWQDGAPGSVDRKSEPESAKDYWVKNVHDPSVTVYLPEQGKANGTSVVIFPGGGHRMLVFTAEGKEPAKYFTDLGVTAFVVKYRLAREEKSPYKIEVHPKQDAQRAIRWVRSHAQDFQIDPERIGIVGFSAGGEVASMVAYSDFEGTSDADGPIDDVSCHSNFQVLIYPGPLGLPQIIPADAPPTFLVVANDDGLSQFAIELLQRFRRADVPIEFHLYAKGGHGFNMGNRSKLKSISSWPDRLTDWLHDNDFVK
jgi:acetyl esterase/lipase